MSKFAIKIEWGGGNTSGSRGKRGAYKSSSIGLKKRQNAPFSFFVSKIFSAGRNIVTNSGRMQQPPFIFTAHSD